MEFYFERQNRKYNVSQQRELNACSSCSVAMTEQKNNSPWLPQVSSASDILYISRFIDSN